MTAPARPPSEPAGPRPSVIRPTVAPGDAESHARALEHVRRVLLAAGAGEEEIEQALAHDVVDLLAVDRLLVPPPRYTRAEVAERAGLPVDLLARFWRALGFPDVPEGERVLTDLDAEAVALFELLAAAGATDPESALQMARVMGSSMARIADSQVAPGWMAVGTETDSVLAADAFATAADTTVPAMAQLLEFVWRRHVQAAARRAMLQRVRSPEGTTPVLTVGFADLVGFTLLTQQLDVHQLGAAVSRFEDLCFDTVTRAGGRVVKMIGDEVMFAADSAAAAAAIGLELAAAAQDDELLGPVRVGLAAGHVLPHEGDLYGTVVNAAHRIVSVAEPGTVLVSEDCRAALETEAPERFALEALAPRSLPGLGRVRLWRCRAT